MKVACVDVGNSNSRLALVDEEGVRLRIKFPTAGIGGSDCVLGTTLEKWLAKEHSRIDGLAFCSVVPAVVPRLIEATGRIIPKSFNLSALNCRGLKVSYPNPGEIGQDRIANAVGAQAFYGVPCIVVDMGTAVTLDVVSPDLGYEGGVIAPGLALMSHYLHEKTALLPEVNPHEWDDIPIIGKSTREAIGIGCKRGFTGMIHALVEPVYDELKRRCGKAPVLVAAGGDSRFLKGGVFSGVYEDEDITLRGLWESFRRESEAGAL